MNGRNIVLAAVAIGLVALIIVFFMSAGDTGGPVAANSPKLVPDAEVGEVLNAPVTVTDPTVRPERAAARQGKLEAAGQAPVRVELPPGAKPEDGGLAFGVSVCDKMETCDCQASAADSCAKGWISVKPEEYGTASCLLDLPCEDLCRMYDHPKDVPCLVQVDDMIKKRFQNR